MITVFLLCFSLVSGLSSCDCHVYDNENVDENENEVQYLANLVLEDHIEGDIFGIFVYSIEAEVYPESLVLKTCLNNRTLSIPAGRFSNNSYTIVLSEENNNRDRVTIVTPRPYNVTEISYNFISDTSRRIVGPVKICLPPAPPPVLSTTAIALPLLEPCPVVECNATTLEPTNHYVTIVSASSNKSLLGLLGLIGLVGVVPIIILMVIIVLICNKRRHDSDSITVDGPHVTTDCIFPTVTCI